MGWTRLKMCVRTDWQMACGPLVGTAPTCSCFLRRPAVSACCRALCGDVRHWVYFGDFVGKPEHHGAWPSKVELVCQLRRHSRGGQQGLHTFMSL